MSPFFILKNWIKKGKKAYIFWTIKKNSGHSPPVDLYLIFEKSSCNNQVRQTGFLASKNQFRN